MEDINLIAALDPFGELDTSSEAAANNSAQLDAAFKTLTGTFVGTSSGASGFGNELNKLVANSLQMHLIKDVADEIKTIEKVKPKLARELAFSVEEHE